MSLVIMEGRIDELGIMASHGGYVVYEWIIINGTEYKHVKLNNRLNTFLTTGGWVRISCVKGITGKHIAQAVQNSEGRILNFDLFTYLTLFFFAFVGLNIILFLPVFYLAGYSNDLQLFILMPIFALVIAILCLQGGFRARTALHRLPKPKVAQAS